MNKQYTYYQYPIKNERFIGPILPFVGGALIGYIVGRPNYNYYQPYYQPYYPIYYPPTNYPYYN